jgi:hypothetical protein
VLNFSLGVDAGSIPDPVLDFPIVGDAKRRCRAFLGRCCAPMVLHWIEHWDGLGAKNWPSLTGATLYGWLHFRLPF